MKNSLDPHTQTQAYGSCIVGLTPRQKRQLLWGPNASACLSFVYRVLGRKIRMSVQFQYSLSTYCLTLTHKKIPSALTKGHWIIKDAVAYFISVELSLVS